MAHKAAVQERTAVLEAFQRRVIAELGAARSLPATCLVQRLVQRPEGLPVDELPRRTSGDDGVYGCTVIETRVLESDDPQETFNVRLRMQDATGAYLPLAFLAFTLLHELAHVVTPLPVQAAHGKEPCAETMLCGAERRARKADQKAVRAPVADAAVGGVGLPCAGRGQAAAILDAVGDLHLGEGLGARLRRDGRRKASAAYNAPRPFRLPRGRAARKPREADSSATEAPSAQIPDEAFHGQTFYWNLALLLRAADVVGVPFLPGVSNKFSTLAVRHLDALGPQAFQDQLGQYGLRPEAALWGCATGAGHRSQEMEGAEEGSGEVMEMSAPAGSGAGPQAVVITVLASSGSACKAVRVPRALLRLVDGALAEALGEEARCKLRLRRSPRGFADPRTGELVDAAATVRQAFDLRARAAAAGNLVLRAVAD